MEKNTLSDSKPLLTPEEIHNSNEISGTLDCAYVQQMDLRNLGDFMLLKLEVKDEDAHNEQFIPISWNIEHSFDNSKEPDFDTFNRVGLPRENHEGTSQFVSINRETFSTDYVAESRDKPNIYTAEDTEPNQRISYIHIEPNQSHRSIQRTLNEIRDTSEYGNIYNETVTSVENEYLVIKEEENDNHTVNSSVDIQMNIKTEPIELVTNSGDIGIYASKNSPSINKRSSKRTISPQRDKNSSKTIPKRRNVGHARKIKAGSDTRAVMSCDLCGLAGFGDLSALFRHMEEHDEEQGGKQGKTKKETEKQYDCQICSKSFLTISDVTNHQGSHDKSDPHVCVVCAEYIGDPDQLRQHLQSHCLSCGDCRENFDTLHASKQHRRSVHNKGQRKSNYASSVAKKRNSIVPSTHTDNSPSINSKPVNSGTTGITSKTVNPENMNSPLVNSINVNSGDLPFSCNTCEKSYATQLGLIHHKRWRHSLQPRPAVLYYCEVCNKTLHSLPALTEHRDKHVTVSGMTQGPEYTCKKCDHKTATKPEMVDHLQQHGADRKFLCDLCDFRGAKLCYLRYHVTKHHGLAISYTCTICGEAAARKGELKQHNAAAHARATVPYECQRCAALFTNESSAHAHESKCGVIFVYDTCELCGGDVTCRLGSEMEVKMKRHLAVCVRYPALYKRRVPRIASERTPARSQCPFCGQGFTSCTEVNEHLVIHASDKPPANPAKTTCHICGEFFQTKQLLKEHFRVHNREANERHKEKTGPLQRIWTQKTQFSCSFCTNTFLNSKDFVAHLLGHEGDRDMARSDLTTVQAKHTVSGSQEYASGSNRSEELSSSVATSNQATSKDSDDVSHEVMISENDTERATQKGTNPKPSENSHEQFDINCQLCDDGSSFKTKSTLLQHIRNEHQFKVSNTGSANKKRGSFECDQCGAIFQQRCSLKKHIQHIHELEKNKVSSGKSNVSDAENEDKTFRGLDTPDKRGLPNEVLIPPDLQKNYVHTIRCNNEKSSSTVKEEDTKMTPPLQSSIIEKSRSTVKRDQKSRVNCTICGKNYAKAGLSRHMDLHTGVKAHSCPICHRPFPRPTDVRRHMVQVHINVRLHTCHVCGKSFKFKHSLKEHMRQHTGEKPYECKHCAKKFSSLPAKNLHEVKHRGGHTLFCEICEKGFFAKANLIRHLDLHTGTYKPHVCVICNVHFKNKYALKRHLPGCEKKSR